MRARLKTLWCVPFVLGVLGLAVSQAMAQGYNMAVKKTKVVQYGTRQLLGDVRLTYTASGGDVGPGKEIRVDYSGLTIHSAGVKCGGNFASSGDTCKSGFSATPADQDDEKRGAIIVKVSSSITPTAGSRLTVVAVWADVSGLDDGDRVLATVTAVEGDEFVPISGGPDDSATGVVSEVVAGLEVEVTRGSRRVCNRRTSGVDPSITVKEGFAAAWIGDTSLGPVNSGQGSAGPVRIRIVNDLPVGVTLTWPETVDSKYDHDDDDSTDPVVSATLTLEGGARQATGKVLVYNFSQVRAESSKIAESFKIGPTKIEIDADKAGSISVSTIQAQLWPEYDRAKSNLMAFRHPLISDPDSPEFLNVTNCAPSPHPNLTPYRPRDWSDKIVVSTVQDSNIDSPGLMASNKLYIDFAVINNGGGSVTESFQINLFVDGQLQQTFNPRLPHRPNHYTFWEDYPIGSLSAGRHTLGIVADAGNSISESTESDNEYTKTITVAGGCFPLTTNVSPQGAGTVTRSQEPTCGGATAALVSLADRDDDPDPQPGRQDMAVEDKEPHTLELKLSRQQADHQDTSGKSTTEAHRTRVFAALTTKAQAQGRVRVIIGLRAEGRAGASAMRNFRDAAARSPLILQAQQSLLIRMSGHSVSSVRKFKYIPYVAMELDAAALEALASDSQVVSIEEDRLLKPMLKESTPLIGAPQAWRQGFSGSGQTIAILDSGVDKNHPFLRGKVVSEACYSGSDPKSSSLCPGGVEESTSPGSGVPCSVMDLPDCVHGTHVAGIAGGKGIQFSGVARDARIISIQVFSKFEPPDCSDEDEPDEPCLRTSTRDNISGLERVLELSTRFDIAAVNMSLGSDAFPGNCDLFFPAQKAAIDNLRAVGIATIAISGNKESPRGISAPACISSAVSVGSTDDGSASDDGSSKTTKDVVSDFSNSSSSLDLLAPGRWITSSIPVENGFFPLSGTSMAAPHVAGAWAVLKSKAPNASVQQVLSALTRTGLPITDPRNNVTRPRIQIGAALNSLTPPLSYTSGAGLTLTATANPGFRFKSWTGCDSVSGNRCTVRMNSGRNVSALFEPAAGAPDLVITSLTGPSTATIGSEVSISASIHNQGSANAGPFLLGVDLLSLDFSDIFPLASCDIDSGLEAGRSSTCSSSVLLSSSITPGTYSLATFVDVQEQVTESNEDNNARLADSGPIQVVSPPLTSRTFVPVVLAAAGRNNTFFTSEMTLTNRGSRDATLNYTYTAALGGGTGTGSEVLAAGAQKIVPDAIGYLKSLGIPIPGSGNRVGTLGVEAADSSDVAALVRTTTAVPGGRAGLAYPGIPSDAGLHEAAYLCGLRHNAMDRSNVALQNPGAQSVTLRTTVFSGDRAAPSSRVLPEVTLAPGGFHQYSDLLATAGFENGYVQVERVSGTGPFYAYGVINDQANSDGSFVFPVTEDSLAGKRGQTLPIIVETGAFNSELTVTNFSGSAKRVDFSFVADAVETADNTATFSLTLQAGEQKIIPNIVTELRQQGVAGIGPAGSTFAGALFATVADGDMSGIVIGARTGPPGGGGQYGVFYNAVPDGSASTDSAWIYGLQQNEENRSNLALVNIGEVDGGDSVFEIAIYDGETGMLINTLTGIMVSARGWLQFNSLLANYAPGTRQGYVQVRKISGNNPFLAYGVINDGATPGQGSGDGALRAGE